jgi:hypothetical protein
MGYWDVEDEARRWPLLLVGAVVGALVVGLIWGVQNWATKDVREESPASDSPAGDSKIVDPGPTDQGSSPDRLGRCREVFEAQTPPLRAADASLTQWEIHIGAMNKLVTGAITLEQATVFWDETRLSARSLLARHNATMRDYFHRTARCPLTRPGTMTSAEATCARSVAARGKVLYYAAIADARWREHVRHMEMLRAGEMSADEATRLWLLNWRKGAQELRKYRAAADTASDLTC